MPRSLLAEFERVDRRFQTSHVRSRTNRSSDNAKSSWYFTLTSGDGSPSPEVEIAKQDVHSEYLDYETGQCISYEILGAHNSTKLTWDDSGTFTLPARSPHFLLGQHINAKPNDHPETPSSEEYVERLLSGLSPMRYEHSSLASYRLSTVADPLGTLQSAECSPISPISNYGIPFPGDKSDSIDEEMNTPVPPTPRRPSSGARRRNSDHPAVRQYRQPHNQTHLLSKFFKSTTPGSLPFSHHPAPSTFRPSAGDHQNVYDLESSVSRTSSYSPDSQGSSAVSYPRDRFEFLCHSPNNEDLKREHVNYMMQPRLPFRGATDQLEASLYREREQRREDDFWPSGELLGSSGNSSVGSDWTVGMDFAVRFVPPRLLRLEFGISEWAGKFFQQVARWMLTAVPPETDPFSDLAYHLSESKETRYTAVLMLTRYLSKVGIFDLTRLRPSKQNVAGESIKSMNRPRGRKKNQHVKKQLIWEIAVACLSLASKLYNDTWYPRHPIMAESLVHIASGVCETMTLVDLHVAEGDIIECLDADLSCVAPQMILEDLVDIVPSLADVAYMRYRWEYIVDLVWDTMISFITDPNILLRFSTSTITAACLYRALHQLLLEDLAAARPDEPSSLTSPSTSMRFENPDNVGDVEEQHAHENLMRRLENVMREVRVVLGIKKIDWLPCIDALNAAPNAQFTDSFPC